MALCADVGRSHTSFPTLNTHVRSHIAYPPLLPALLPKAGDKIEAFEVVQKSLRLEEAKGAVAMVDMDEFAETPSA